MIFDKREEHLRDRLYGDILEVVMAELSKKMASFAREDPALELFQDINSGKYSITRHRDIDRAKEVYGALILKLEENALTRKIDVLMDSLLGKHINSDKEMDTLLEGLARSPSNQGKMREFIISTFRERLTLIFCRLLELANIT